MVSLFWQSFSLSLSLSLALCLSRSFSLSLSLSLCVPASLGFFLCACCGQCVSIIFVFSICIYIYTHFFCRERAFSWHVLCRGKLLAIARRFVVFDCLRIWTEVDPDGDVSQTFKPRFGKLPHNHIKGLEFDVQGLDLACTSLHGTLCTKSLLLST